MNLIFLDSQDFFMKIEKYIFKTLIYFFKNTFWERVPSSLPNFYFNPMICQCILTI